MTEYLKEVENLEHYNNVFSEDVNDNKVYLLDVYASWCGPCKMLLPIVETVAEEYANDNIQFYKMNCDLDDFKNIAKNTLGVTSIPALIFFKNGQIVKKFGNPKTKAALIELINEVLNG